MLNRPIYYLEATISYTKGKNKHKSRQWMVSIYDTASDIMLKDAKTMQSLKERIYGNTYKGAKNITIIKIYEKREVGKTNW